MIDKIRAGLVSHLELVDPAGWEPYSYWPLEEPQLGGGAHPDDLVPVPIPPRPPASRWPGR